VRPKKRDCGVTRRLWNMIYLYLNVNIETLAMDPNYDDISLDFLDLSDEDMAHQDLRPEAKNIT
jgi:hypothetical protein